MCFDFEAAQCHASRDEDTSVLSLAGPHSIIEDRVSDRVLGLDAPEGRSKCDRENTLARQARGALRDLL
jgi:hypothetical protein